jgi:hypothetical protein
MPLNFKPSKRFKDITKTRRFSAVIPGPEISFRYDISVLARNAKLLKSGLRVAQEDLVAAYDTALKAAIRSSNWETPSGRADIVDSGELLRSQQLEINGTKITVSYSAPYANLVEFGGYINPYGNKNVRVYLPPRPWVRSVLFGGNGISPVDIETIVGLALNKLFN